MKETRTPEVLTINSRAEIVMLDTETYENLMEQLSHTKAVAAARAHMAQAGKNAPPQEPITEAEIERRQALCESLSRRQSASACIDNHRTWLVLLSWTPAFFIRLLCVSFIDARIIIGQT